MPKYHHTSQKRSDFFSSIFSQERWVTKPENKGFPLLLPSNFSIKKDPASEFFRSFYKVFFSCFCFSFLVFAANLFCPERIKWIASIHREIGLVIWIQFPSNITHFLLFFDPSDTSPLISITKFKQQKNIND